MKRKSDFVSIFDDLRSEEPKKRLSSINGLKFLAQALGPAKTRSQLIPYLFQFMDDQDHIVLSLLSQLKDFIPLVGGSQYSKVLLPLLISFCKMDDKPIALKASEQVIAICGSNSNLLMEVLKSLSKQQMLVTKQSMAFIISSLISKTPTVQLALLEFYNALFSSSNPSSIIIGTKYLNNLYQGMRNKQPISKIIQTIYSASDQLPKIYALPVLIGYYQQHPALTLNIIKHLAVLNSWRVNMKLIEHSDLIAKTFSSADFKSSTQPIIMKGLTSKQDQLRAASIKGLQPIFIHCSQQEIRLNVLPLISTLSADSVDYVRIQLSSSLPRVLNFCGKQFCKQSILPLFQNCFKSLGMNFMVGILGYFQLVKNKMNEKFIIQNIIRPLVTNISSQDWRMRCQILQVMQKSAESQIIQNQLLYKSIIELTDDRIDQVRQYSVQLITKIIQFQPQDWLQKIFLPSIVHLASHKNYTRRQAFLQICSNCMQSHSNLFKEQFKSKIVELLNDPIPNVRVKAILICKENKFIVDVNTQKKITNLKDDSDPQVRETVKLQL